MEMGQSFKPCYWEDGYTSRVNESATGVFGKRTVGFITSLAVIYLATQHHLGMYC